MSETVCVKKISYFNFVLLKINEHVIGKLTNEEKVLEWLVEQKSKNFSLILNVILIS